MPRPDDFWQWLVGGVASAAGGLFGYHKYVDGRIEKMADKKSMDKLESDIQTELTIHRSYFKDVFNQIRESDQKSEERHRELLMHLVQRKD